MEVIVLGKGLSQQFNTLLWLGSKKLRGMIVEEEKTLCGGSCHTLGLDLRVQTPSTSQNE
jgi:hypothetical protein